VENNQLHVAWLGDSQALLVRAGTPIKLVTPHKPEDEVRSFTSCMSYYNKSKNKQLLPESRELQ